MKAGRRKFRSAIQSLFDFTNLFLHAAFNFIRAAFGLEALISHQLTSTLLYGAFGFLGGSFHFIVSTVFHSNVLV